MILVARPENRISATNAVALRFSRPYPLLGLIYLVGPKF
jgi:hypothetical protein